MPRLVGLYRHDAPVSCAEMSPDGKRVVTASYDGIARIWDVATGAQVGGDLKHPGHIYRALFSPDGLKIATAGGDGSARVWDAATGAPLAAPLEHALGVYALAFSPDGKTLATGVGNPFNYVNPPAGVKGTDQDRALLKPRPGKPFAALWDLHSGGCVPLATNSHMVVALSFSGDGKRVALSGPNEVSAEICATDSGKVVAGPFKHADTLTAAGYVFHLALSADGKRLITGTLDNTVHIWEVDAGKKLNVRGLPGANAFFSTDGSRVVGQGPGRPGTRCSSRGRRPASPWWTFGLERKRTWSWHAKKRVFACTRRRTGSP